MGCQAGPARQDSFKARGERQARPAWSTAVAAVQLGTPVAHHCARGTQSTLDGRSAGRRGQVTGEQTREVASAARTAPGDLSRAKAAHETQRRSCTATSDTQSSPSQSDRSSSRPRPATRRPQPSADALAPHPRRDRDRHPAPRAVQVLGSMRREERVDCPPAHAVGRIRRLDCATCDRVSLRRVLGSCRASEWLSGHDRLAAPSARVAGQLDRPETRL